MEMRCSAARTFDGRGSVDDARALACGSVDSLKFRMLYSGLEALEAPLETPGTR